MMGDVVLVFGELVVVCTAAHIDTANLIRNEAADYSPCRALSDNYSRSICPSADRGDYFLY